jgi:crotonobetainyl-CoA:carnitine CoA-transferase CaiB-like acyl-CoA transferase
MTRPLADLRIVAVEQYGAGPWGSMQLADLGAEVIKVEDPTTGGDVGRYVPPFQEGEDSLFFETMNRNKKSVSLDLRAEGGREVFEDLVRHADAVYSNLRGDGPRRLRITYDDLKDVNPRIVCCSLSGFGMTGPRAAQGGYDYVVQAMAGWMSLTGDPDGPPTKSGLSLVDLSGGYVAALALVAGAWRARRDGVGCDCDISLFETALSELIYVGTWAATTGWTPKRMPESAHPSIVPFQAFATSDGWLTVACAKQKFWERFCSAIGREDLLEDVRFADFAARDVNRDELLPILRAELRRRTTAEWIDVFADAGVPAGPVYDVHQALDDPQVHAREAVVAIDHPRFGPVRQVASPLRVAWATDPAPLARGPLRGEHTEEVLEQICGYDAERLARLREAGAFGTFATAPDTAEAEL